ncbi:AAA family ATPase [Aquimarina sp. 2201CG5-10]|uniref:AAA family ATPase n=1 Tax=Aquimarina callyspongiae TaxID=3098150 RepID=UPI002AB42839|nr:AAA family ATPase [Aquimarina sp. 2201CG5-10]MDY8137454.1 AAA family ATPase [Aquimarina sp. 2201CG5-10]
MKINKISVDNLFGVFNHSIKINNEVGITIIIGENGLGKTVMLEMIEAFFKGHYLYFTNVTFAKMTFEFEDKITWVLTKEEKNEDLPMLSLTQINKNGKEYNPIKLFEFGQDHLQMLARRISRNSPYLRRVHPKYWEDRRTGERVHIEELIYRYGDRHQLELNFNDDDKPKWFTDKYENINVSLIETQRLISIEKREDNNQEKTVEKYSKELSRLIKNYLTESTELSSKLDRTYPNRLIERLKNSTNISKEILNEQLKKLEEKRETLDVAGLIEIEKDSNLLDIENPGNEIIDVLMLYVEDSFEKIKIFDTISKKIEILLDIINKRFKHKKLIIDKEEGFLFKSTIIKDEENNFQTINVNQLSSGEQNELVLFYSLLFKTKKDSLILIDEPEVSLHISWQNSFIHDLKEITKLNNLDVLIATHSPDIIANNWDLKVELKGLE